MHKETLLKYLKNKNILDEELYDSLAFDLNKQIYFFGNHFKRSIEKVKQERRAESLKYKLRALQAANSFSQSIKKFDVAKPVIISNAYFTTNEEIAALGYNVIAPPWISSAKNNGFYNKALINLSFKIRSSLELEDFNYLIGNFFISLIKQFRDNFKKLLTEKKIAALVVSNDEGFFENISIKICKALSIPTFIFLHGLPAVYNGKDGNRADYLLVWGKKIKELFILSGIHQQKIFISGHPYYKNLSNNVLKFSLENILVLTKAMNWSQHIDEVILKDRAQLIVYLLKIEAVLKKIGIQKVRFRPHPSENANWYLSFLDNDFFILDMPDMKTSLNTSSLVIGPTSSVFLEAIYAGVNYTIFEPLINKKDLFDNTLFAPFDGSDNRIPVANTEEELLHILRNKTAVQHEVLHDYLQTPFDISFIKNLL